MNKKLEKNTKDNKNNRKKVKCINCSRKLESNEIQAYKGMGIGMDSGGYTYGYYEEHPNNDICIPCLFLWAEIQKLKNSISDKKQQLKNKERLFVRLQKLMKKRNLKS